MSEQNKDNISQFFRKAVQKPKIRFEESDWEKLEARLDSDPAAAVSKPNHWKTAFIAAVVLLFISTSLLFYNGRQPNNNITVKTEVKNADAKSATSKSSLSKNKKLQDEKRELKAGTGTTPDKNALHASLLSNTERKEATTSLVKGNTVSSEKPAGSLQSEEPGKATLFQNTAISDNITKVAVANLSSDKEVNSQSLPVDSSSTEEQKDPIQKTKLNLSDSLTESVKSKPSRWNIMLSLSPDFSSTDLDKFSTPGSAFGIAAYYTINKKFSVSVGVVKSSKFYWDNGDEYKPNQAGYWTKKTNGIVPTTIEGSCSVLEIPIGLQYYFVSAKRNKLYLTSTLSSYIMLKESYQYIFDSPNPGAAQSWNAKKASYSLFNVANLAVGYERSISNRLMIGVSPYIKIPISGIGSWANLKLYSTGAAFTLRYQFQKKKKPDRLIPAD